MQPSFRKRETVHAMPPICFPLLLARPVCDLFVQYLPHYRTENYNVNEGGGRKKIHFPFPTRSPNIIL